VFAMALFAAQAPFLQRLGRKCIPLQKKAPACRGFFFCEQLATRSDHYSVA
jgi:hypothetical protein